MAPASSLRSLVAAVAAAALCVAFNIATDNAEALGGLVSFVLPTAGNSAVRLARRAGLPSLERGVEATQRAKNHECLCCCADRGQLYRRLLSTKLNYATLANRISASELAGMSSSLQAANLMRDIRLVAAHMSGCFIVTWGLICVAIVQGAEAPAWLLGTTVLCSQLAGPSSLGLPHHSAIARVPA